MPGDPIDLMRSADPRISAADVARLKAVYGLDRPLVDRYFAWLRPGACTANSAIRGCSPRRSGGAAAAARQLAAADGSELRAGLGAGAGARDRRRAAPDLAARRGGQPVLLRRRVDADLLARPGADPGVRRRARLAAGERHRDRRARRRRRPAAASGLAGGDADPGQRRRLYPLCARRDARGAGAGPYPHRPRQGSERGAGRLAPCAAHARWCR